MHRAVLALVLGVCAFAPPPAAAPPLTALVTPFIQRHQVPGLSVAVVRDGVLADAIGVGTQRPDGGAAIGPDTRFRIASVTKVMTAVAILQMVERGQLALDDSAHARCPEFAPAGGDPTLRQVMAHQAGIRHTSDAEDATITGDTRLGDAVSRLAGEPLRFAPGSSVLYSSWGYAVLGCAIEHAAGRRYFDALRASVLDRAGMTATVADRPDFAAPDFTHGFRLQQGQLVPSAVVDTRFKQSASGVISTATDLVRFTTALFDHRLLAEGTQQTSLFARQSTASGTPSDYTLGLIAARKADNGAAFYHTGSMEGTSALLYLIPSRRLAIVILANRERFVPELAALVPDILALYSKS